MVSWWQGHCMFPKRFCWPQPTSARLCPFSQLRHHLCEHAVRHSRSSAVVQMPLSLQSLFFFHFSKVLLSSVGAVQRYALHLQQPGTS